MHYLVDIRSAVNLEELQPLNQDQLLGTSKNQQVT